MVLARQHHQNRNGLLGMDHLVVYCLIQHNNNLVCTQSAVLHWVDQGNKIPLDKALQLVTLIPHDKKIQLSIHQKVHPGQFHYRMNQVGKAYNQMM